MVKVSLVKLFKNKEEFKVSGNCPKVTEQMKKYLFKTIYQILVRTMKFSSLNPKTVPSTSQLITMRPSL